MWDQAPTHGIEGHLPSLLVTPNDEHSRLGAAFQRGGWWPTRLSRTFMPSTNAQRSGAMLWITLPHMPCIQAFGRACLRRSD